MQSEMKKNGVTRDLPRNYNNLTIYLLIAFSLAGWFVAVPAGAQGWLVERASLTNSGAQGENSMGSHRPSISYDGRYVAFVSAARNLVEGDTNGQDDIFVRDRKSTTTIRANLDASGNQLSGYGTSYARLSGNGKVGAFATQAGNVVPGATAGVWQVYIRDRQLNQTTLVSRSTEGTAGNGDSDYPFISGNGRHVAFNSKANNLVSGLTGNSQQYYIHDRQTGETQLLSVSTAAANASCYSTPVLSRDGRYAAFDTSATNLVTGTPTSIRQVYLRDTVGGTTILVSRTATAVGDDASGNPAISPDGRFVYFDSKATNFVPALTETTPYSQGFVYDHQNQNLSRISLNAVGVIDASYFTSTGVISEGGRFAAFGTGRNDLVPGDTNTATDVFVATQTTDGWTIQPKGTIGGWRNDLAVAGNIAYVTEGTNVVLYDISGDTLVKRSQLMLPVEPAIIAVSGEEEEAVRFAQFPFPGELSILS